MAEVSLDLYSVFVAIADAKSVTGAAKRLRTTPSTVSRSLARLEAELGTALVHRSTRRLTLSSAGASLYERVAASVVALMGAADTPPLAPPHGTLRVTAPEDVGMYILPEVLAVYAARFPEIDVELKLMNDVLNLVAEGIDVALRAATRPMVDSELQSRKLATIVMGIYAAPSYLARHGFPSAVGASGHDWLVHVTAKQMIKKPVKAKLVSDDMLVLREFAERGMGVAVIPHFVAAPALLAGALTRVLADEPQPTAYLMLVYPSNGNAGNNVHLFRDVVLETLRGRPLPS